MNCYHLEYEILELSMVTVQMTVTINLFVMMMEICLMILWYVNISNLKKHELQHRHLKTDSNKRFLLLLLDVGTLDERYFLEKHLSISRDEAQMI